jgi:hypothetical protein
MANADAHGVLSAQYPTFGPSKPHQTSEQLYIAFSLSGEQACVVMVQLGVHMTAEEVTPQALIDAITTFRL